jgi:hypothetical protein
MSALNEWELLVVEQDIEPGDTLEVTNLRSRSLSTDKMVFFRTTRSIKTLQHDDLIVLIDKKGKQHKFEIKTLEEIAAKTSRQRYFIVGRSTMDMSIKRRTK